MGYRTVTVATWNTEWRSPQSRDGKIIKDRLQATEPEVLCLTEADRRLLDDWGGHQIEGTTDWGGPSFEVRRKVLLWSKQPWQGVDQIGSPDLPAGMFVRGTTETSIGELTVLGLVIPYHMANVRFGRRDRKMWEEHEQYLDALMTILHQIRGRCVVMGDFNQRIPSNWVPERLQAKLHRSFHKVSIRTADLRGPGDDLAIDHIACSSDIKLVRARVISHLRDDGKEISDHFGISAAITVRS